MSVIRYDLEACVGCRRCFFICPQDVFRFNEEEKKSVIAYPESCISCGQCFVNCVGHSLALSDDAFGYTLTATRSAVMGRTNRKVLIPGQNERRADSHG